MAKDVKNIVEIVKLVAAAGSAYDASKADGKLDLQDLVHLLPVVPYVEPAVNDIKEVIPEFEDLSNEELSEIMIELQKIGFIGREIELANKIRVSMEAVHAIYKAYLVFAKKEVPNAA